MHRSDNRLLSTTKDPSLSGLFLGQMTVDARTNDVDLTVPIQPTSSKNRFEIINIDRGCGRVFGAQLSSKKFSSDLILPLRH